MVLLSCHSGAQALSTTSKVFYQKCYEFQDDAEWKQQDANEIS